MPESQAGDQADQPADPWKWIKGLMNWVVFIIIAFGLYSCVRDTLKTYTTSIDARVEGYPTTPSASAKIDAISFYKTVISIMKRCDNASFELQSGLYGSDPVTQYQSAKAAVMACEDDQEKYDQLKIPESLGHQIATLVGRAAYACALSENYRTLSALALQSGVEKGVNVRKIAEARDLYMSAVRAKAECREEFLSATRSIGVAETDILT